VSVLTGSACNDIDIDDIENAPDLWQKLEEAQNRGYIITTYTVFKKHTEDKVDDFVEGLRKGHAYTVLQVADIGQAKLIKLRNPWAFWEWEGDWSDTSEKWTPELREQLSVVKEDDGCFWMCCEDFVKHFYRVSINSYHDSDEPHTSIAASQKSGSQSLFTCDLEAGRHSFIITKKGFWRKYTMLVAKFKGGSIEDGLEVLYGQSFEKNVSEETRCDFDLEAGKYLVLITSDINYSVHYEFEFDLWRYGPGSENIFHEQTDLW